MTVTAIQLGVGILMGLTSVGSGSLVILSMLWLFDMPAKLIVGSSIVIALIMILPAAATHFVAAGVGWATLTPMLAEVGRRCRARLQNGAPHAGAGPQARDHRPRDAGRDRHHREGLVSETSAGSNDQLLVERAENLVDPRGGPQVEKG